MSDQRTERLHGGRRIAIMAYGDTVTELEMDALDKARAFFGSDVRLEIWPEYGVIADPINSDRKYFAGIYVREVP